MFQTKVKSMCRSLGVKQPPVTLGNFALLECEMQRDKWQEIRKGRDQVIKITVRLDSESTQNALPPRSILIRFSFHNAGWSCTHQKAL